MRLNKSKAMSFKFWRSVKPFNVNKNALPKGCRGKEKGSLASEFQKLGFVDRTQVLLIDNNAEGRAVASSTTFGQIPSEATYKGRGNRITGKGSHGFIHVFDIS